MTGLRDGTFGGMAMHGRWDVFLMMAFCLVILNIGGEELWWRGIIAHFVANSAALTVLWKTITS